MEGVLDATKLAALHLIVAYTVYLHCALRGRARELRYLWTHRAHVRSAVPVSQIECDAEAYDARRSHQQLACAGRCPAAAPPINAMTKAR
jgi:hypothetical protein